MKLTTLDEIGVLLIKAIRKLMGVANQHVTTSAALKTIQPVRTYREQSNSTNAGHRRPVVRLYAGVDGAFALVRAACSANRA